MAEGYDQKTTLEQDNRERLRLEIRNIQLELDEDLTELRTRFDPHYVMEKAVIFLADKAGEMCGTSVGLLRRFKKNMAA